MRPASALLVLCAGCGPQEDPEVNTSRAAADYAGPPLMHLDLVAPTDTAAAPVMLRVSEAQDSWETRVGDRWSDGTDSRTWAVSLDGDLRVDDTLLLPARVSEGVVLESCTVTAVGEREVWYGLFPDVVSVQIAEGPFAGEQAFARDVGPILLTWSGEVWELASYEQL